MRKSLVYRIFIWASLIISLLILWRLNNVLTHPKYIPADDFVRHWAAGRLFITGKNPYSPAEIQTLQDQATGIEAKSEVITPNYIPPWTIPFLAIFGIADYPLSRLSWLLVNVAILLVSIELIWKLYGGQVNRKWIAWIVCFCFGPTISVLEKGQTSSLILLGIAGFLFFVEIKPVYWLAGVFIVFITMKPQVFYLFWPVFLFWIIKKRHTQVVIGFLGAIAILSGISLFFDPKIFTEYLYALQNYPPTMFATPTIGGFLRYFVFGVNQFWPQFIPTVLGFIWGFYIWYNDHAHWTWSKGMPALLFASIITSSYSWTYDQVILVAPALQAWIWLIAFPEKSKRIGFISLYFLLSLFDLVLHRYLDDFWFIWFAPGMLLWYQMVQKEAKHNEPIL